LANARKISGLLVVLGMTAFLHLVTAKMKRRGKNTFRWSCEHDPLRSLRIFWMRRDECPQLLARGHPAEEPDTADDFAFPPAERLSSPVERIANVPLRDDQTVLELKDGLDPVDDSATRIGKRVGIHDPSPHGIPLLHDAVDRDLDPFRADHVPHRMDLFPAPQPKRNVGKRSIVMVTSRHGVPCVMCR
jgi:hypothetical protein